MAETVGTRANVRFRPQPEPTPYTADQDGHPATGHELEITWRKTG